MAEKLRAGKPMAERTTRKLSTSKSTVAIVGAGSLATFLAVVLNDAGFTITEIVARDSPRSRRHARALAAKVGAQTVTAHSAALDATLLWFCVPDREIRGAASALAAHLAARAAAHKKGRAQGRVHSKVRFAFHSSGALLSRELEPLRKAGAAVASVHPLMTFVAGAHPSLTGVPFAMEGDDAATRLARRIVREMGGESFSLPAARKAAYHAWATLTSPLLLAFLVTLEDVARTAGLTRQDARRKSLPIIRQTLANYSRLGPAQSFSGPLVRGDAETVARHLAVLQKHPRAREVYVALARAALRGLPVKNRDGLNRLLRD
ncbi:MAG TPA: DUF2520 domain-containing protein [Terriglobales bacterium]|nr:DUF2520 domain-containing protein [Terriglobales bacterium]